MALTPRVKGIQTFFPNLTYPLRTAMQPRLDDHNWAEIAAGIMGLDR